ncbi:MAG: hypothetical protein L0H93_16245, partial [Nocardioides sp.]|nr:hypothetical protein [Nocardioides sp.]
DERRDVVGDKTAGGAAVAGQLADWGGQTPAFAVTVGAGVVATVMSWSSSQMLSRAEEGSALAHLDLGPVELGEQDCPAQI